MLQPAISSRPSSTPHALSSGFPLSSSPYALSPQARFGEKEQTGSKNEILEAWWIRLGLMTLELVAILLIVFFVLRLFVIQPFTVVGTSMYPNLVPNDEVYVNRLSYWLKEPDRGDIVVLVPPNDNSRYYVKRIVGLPGETIQITGDGQVLLYNNEYPSGISLIETYVPDPLSTYGYVIEELGEDEYFVMGDNREASSDSRGNIHATVDDGSHWTLPRENIVGKVFIRSKPISHLSLFGEPEYNLK